MSAKGKNTDEQGNLLGSIFEFLKDLFYEYGPSRRRPRASERDAVFPDGNPHKAGPKPVPKPLEDVKQEERLKVEKVDLHIEENALRHHTDRYECTEKTNASGNIMEAELVIRRGEEFKVTIEFDQPYNKEKHDLGLIFQLGNGSPGKMTKITCKLDEDGKQNYSQLKQWGARLDSTEGKAMTIFMYTPPDCPIGEWELGIRTFVETEDEKPKVWLYRCPDDISIILNPWCKDDEVYFPDEKLLDEYVLNDAGCQFFGSWDSIAARPWNFGQFDSGILDAALHLVRKGFRHRMSSAMGDPVKIARNLSRVVNNFDDGGVLVGKWRGDYSDGKKPFTWSGSVKILRQYMETKKSVKYGQCWVFSALLTTVCRAIGLPCRSVTNFESAHDTDSSLTIDTFFEEDDEGNMVKSDSSDSVWNFHVWNEVWMARHDIGPDYSGWQAIDATPQEESDGVFCCGPSPIRAIKNGEVNKGYDAMFIFAEVNADKIDWIKSGDEYKVLKTRKYGIGRRISTHAPTGKGFKYSTARRNMLNSDERHDLTLDYKYSEGSENERLAVHKAVSLGKGKRYPYATEDSGVSLNIEKQDDVTVGESFSLSMIVTNTSPETLTVDPSVTITAVSYNGRNLKTFLKKKFETKILKAGQAETLKLEVDGDEAVYNTDESFCMKIVGTAFVKENYLRTVETSEIRLQRPDLVLEGPETCKRDETITIKISYTNPLNKPITNCSLDFEAGLQCVSPTVDLMKIGDIQAKSKWETEVTMKPKFAPRSKMNREMTATMNCDENMEIVGIYTVELTS